MGLFGKLFEKKECDICGGEIGLLGNRKLDDGNLCKNCAKKLSPWFEDRRHSTVEEIRQQLADREANKGKVLRFQITRDFKGSSKHVFLDERNGWFAIGVHMNEEENPDILELSQITSCRLDIQQNRTEEYYEDKEGERKSYNPPRYNYSYDYRVKLTVNAPWFDEMELALNTFDVEEHDRRRIVEMENLGNEIVDALNGRRTQMGMGSICCDKCGWRPVNMEKIPRFCPNCGDPIDWNDCR